MEDNQFKLTQQQKEELAFLVIPLQQWMNKNLHPHCKAIVDSENMELMEGITSVQRVQRS